MRPQCPYCVVEGNNSSGPGQSRIHCKGRFRRSSDRRWVRRYVCTKCRRWFSSATSDPFYRSRTRNLNQQVYEALCSTNSQRRSARTLKISRGTIARKLVIFGSLCEKRIAEENAQGLPIEHCQFDDLETHEHTKMKPLSVTIAVAEDRSVLALAVSQMPARGHLAKKARAKYGERKDERKAGRKLVFNKLLPIVSANVLFRSDENPHYPADLKATFPFATHEASKGRAPRSHGQGELKLGAADPLFALNHTCAMFRANVNRLLRKTWCTTKRPDRLSQHMHIYADYHNQWIQKKRPPQHPQVGLKQGAA